VQWHKAIIKILKVYTGKTTDIQPEGTVKITVASAGLCSDVPTLMSDNQPIFVLDHSQCFVSNLLHSKPLLPDSWKLDMILYVLFVFVHIVTLPLVHNL
jgi:hypothetical protein